MSNAFEEFLAEKVTDDAFLWAAYFGVPPKNDQAGNLEQLINNCCSVEREAKILTQMMTVNAPCNALVHGRYGTGKTSFMRMLWNDMRKLGKTLCPPEVDPLSKLHQEIGDSYLSGDPHAKEVQAIWLHMPSLTAGLPHMTVCMVMAAIIEALDKAGKEVEIREGLNDLWRLESTFGKPGFCENGDLEPPRPSSFSGTNAPSLRIIHANCLESSIQDLLYKQKKVFVLFLDDLDRCDKDVHYRIIRLLLRLSAARRIHTVMASDYEVMQNGVKAWMNTHGIGVKRMDSSMAASFEDNPIVSANSALNKYIHHDIEMPHLFMPILAGDGDVTIVDFLKHRFGEIAVADDGTLVTVTYNKLIWQAPLETVKKITSKKFGYGSCFLLVDFFVFMLVGAASYMVEGSNAKRK